MKKKLIFVAVVIILAIGVVIGFSKKSLAPGSTKSTPKPVTETPTDQNSSNQANSTTTPETTTSDSSPIKKDGLAEPVAGFKSRVTKKPFGIYVTPQNSPISPERFTGYHTGADAEYQDVTTDVPVYAVADGKVVSSRTASGYGGVFIIEISLNGKTQKVLYGHIRPSSLPRNGQRVNKGEQIGLLGTGYSSETDGERRHLHFAISSNNVMKLLGYVSTEKQLSNWQDPLKYF